MSLSVNDIVDAKVHVGTLKNESHSKMWSYFQGVVNGVTFFKPEVVVSHLEAAKKKIEEAKKKWLDVLVACEKKMYSEELATIAEKSKVHYLNYKIPAGFLTNFDTLIKRIASMNEMSAFISSPNFFSLTKKEQLIMKRKLARAEKIYKGVKNLTKRPDLVVIVDGAMMTGLISEVEKIHADSIVIASANFAKRWDPASLVPANMLSYKSLDFVMKYLFLS